MIEFSLRHKIKNAYVVSKYLCQHRPPHKQITTYDAFIL